MHVGVAAEKIFTVFSWPVSNTVLTAWIAIILLSVLAFMATRNMKRVPSGLQNFFEWVIESLFGIAEEFMGDRKKTIIFFPLLATLFIFIIATNWLGLLPGFGSIGWHEGEEFVPLLRSTNADMNTTLMLAVVSVVSIQIGGIMALGFFKYWNKFITFKNPMAFFIGLIELVSEAAKLISFSFRLFGAVFAGEVLLTVIASLAPYLLPLPFYGLEIFIGGIQALVFMLLTTVFIKLATTEAGH